MTSRTVQLRRVLRARPELVYRAFLEPDAFGKWIPPDGFTCPVDHMEGRVGGTFRMAFTAFVGERQTFEDASRVDEVQAVLPKVDRSLALGPCELRG